MSITKDIPVVVARAEIGDDYDVLVTVVDPITRKSATTSLDVDEAVSLVDEIRAVIEEAREARATDDQARATATVVHDFDVDWPVHPECVAGKCGNCDGMTMDSRDEMVPCCHACHGAQRLADAMAGFGAVDTPPVCAGCQRGVHSICDGMTVTGAVGWDARLTSCRCAQSGHKTSVEGVGA